MANVAKRWVNDQKTLWTMAQIERDLCDFNANDYDDDYDDNWRVFDLSVHRSLFIALLHIT